METQVTVFLIQESTPPEVKFNIFKRTNTGGLPLSSQEIRHALHQGKATALLQKLAESAEFLTATNEGIRDDRMGDRECILRLLAFMRSSYREYRSKNLDAFLNQCMMDLNKLTDSGIVELDNRFRTKGHRVRRRAHVMEALGRSGNVRFLFRVSHFAAHACAWVSKSCSHPFTSHRSVSRFKIAVVLTFPEADAWGAAGTTLATVLSIYGPSAWRGEFE